MQSILSDLFRKIESDIGTQEFCSLVLNALKSALKQYKFHSTDDFVKHLLQVFDLIKSTKPRYAILLDSFYRFLKYYEKQKDPQSILKLIDEIERIKIAYMLEAKQMVDVVGADVDVKDKNILIYDHSHSVQHILEFFVKKHKKFNVIIAEQDIEKTEDNISFCHRLGIPYKVVPSYMLSQMDQAIDMLFFGAVTFQEGYQFVMDPGSKSIISHFHLEKKPAYVFLTTSKFSLWEISDKKQTVYSVKNKRHHHCEHSIEFERIKFSHDRVPLDLISFVGTEKGIHNTAEFTDMFDEMFQRRAAQRSRVRSLKALVG